MRRTCHLLAIGMLLLAATGLASTPTAAQRAVDPERFLLRETDLGPGYLFDESGTRSAETSVWRSMTRRHIRADRDFEAGPLTIVSGVTAPVGSVLPIVGVLPGVLESAAGSLLPAGGPPLVLEILNGPTVGTESRWAYGARTTAEGLTQVVYAVAFHQSGMIAFAGISGWSEVSGPELALAYGQLMATRMRENTVVVPPRPTSTPRPSPTVQPPSQPVSQPPVGVLTAATPTAAPPGEPTATPSTSGLRPGFNAQDYLGQGDRYNCADFRTQAEAQAVLRGNVRDPNVLDPDNDGIACEANPPPFDREPVIRQCRSGECTTPGASRSDLLIRELSARAETRAS
jgi:hypothetical protein